MKLFKKQSLLNNKQLQSLLNNKQLQSLFSFEKAHHILITVLLLLYLIFDVDTPLDLAKYIDTTLGNVVVVLLSLSLVYTGNVFIGVLAIVSAYELIQRSKKTTGSLYLNQIHNAEVIKKDLLDNYNQFPDTLEEEVVNKMAPLINTSSNNVSMFQPVLNDLHDATEL